MAELSTIARPYADAVFQRAVESDSVQQWLEELQSLSMVVSNPQLSALLDNPTVSRKQQVDIILSVLEALSDEAKNLVRLLSENGRLEALTEITRAYDELKVKHEGKVDVEMTTAFPVDEAHMARLVEALKIRLGKEVNLVTKEDSSLIGGIIIQAGDFVIDGSVKAKLSRLATDLGI